MIHDKKKKKHTRTLVLCIAGGAAVLVGLFVFIFAGIPALRYSSAVKQMNTGAYESAMQTFTALGNYRDSAENIKKCRYGYASVLAGQGEHFAAAQLYAAMPLYEDCAQLFAEQKQLALQNAQIGDLVYFGIFEQDGYKSTKEEPLCWVVADKDGDKLLLAAQSALTNVHYSDSTDCTGWQDCTLRTYLNEDFYDASFSSQEQQQIALTDLADSGTRDKVFLLSLAQVQQYFPANEDRLLPATTYAQSLGTYQDEQTGACWWWLRDMGSKDGAAMGVDIAGNLVEDGTVVTHNSRGARPAIWVSISN